MDEKIQTEVKKIADNDCSHEFFSKIDSITLENIPEELKTIEYPQEGILEISGESIKIKIRPQNVDLITWKYEEIPKINMIRKSNNIYEILFNSNNHVKLSAKNNIERDIIGMTIRMIAGEKLLENMAVLEDDENNDKKSEENLGDLIIEKQNSKELNIFGEMEKSFSATLKRTSVNLRRNSSNNYELLIKMEQLNREVIRHMKEKENLKQEIVISYERNQALEAINKDLNDRLETCTNNYYELDKEHEELKKKNESFMNQKHFFLQEIDIYKAESMSKDEIIDKLKKEMNKLMPSFPNKHKLTWVEVEDLKKSVEDMVSKIAQLKKEKTEFAEKFERNQEISEEMNKKHEEMMNEINYLRKKCESLIQEKVIMPQTPKKEASFENIDAKNDSFSNSLIKGKENIKEKTKENSEESDRMGNSLIGNKGNYQAVFSCVEEENKKLKEQVNQLEITIET